MQAAGARRGVGTEARSRKGVVNIPLTFHRDLRKTWAEVRANDDNINDTITPSQQQQSQHSLLNPPELPPFGRAAKKQSSQQSKGSPTKDGVVVKPELTDEEKEARRAARELRAKQAADKRAADEHNADGEWTRVIPGDPPPKPKPPPPPVKKEQPSYLARGQDATKYEAVRDTKVPKHERIGVAAPTGERAYTPGPGSYHDGTTTNMNPRASKRAGTTVNLAKQTGRDTSLLSRIPTYRGGTVYIAPTAAIAVGQQHITHVPVTDVTKLARTKGGRLSRVITEGIRQLISIIARLEDIRNSGELTRHMYDKVEHELFAARQQFKVLSPWLPIPPPSIPIPQQPSQQQQQQVQQSPTKKSNIKGDDDDAMKDDNDDNSDNHDSDMDMDQYDDDYDTAMSKRAAAEAERLVREVAAAEEAARRALDDEMAIYDDPKPPPLVTPQPLPPVDEVALLEEELQHLSSHAVQHHKPPSPYRMKLAGKFHRLRRRIERLAGDLLTAMKTRFEHTALHPPVSVEQQALQSNSNNNSNGNVTAAVTITDPLLRLQANVGALQKMVTHATHVGVAANAMTPMNQLVTAMQQRLIALQQWQQKQPVTITTNNDDNRNATTTNNDDRTTVKRVMTQLEKVVRESMATLGDLIREAEIFAPRGEEINSAFRAAPRGYSFGIGGKPYEPPSADTPPTGYQPPSKVPVQIYTELATAQDNMSVAHRALGESPAIHGGTFASAPRNPADSAANRRQVPSPLKERYPFLRTPREQRALQRAADAAIGDVPYDIIKPRLQAATIGPAKDDMELEQRRQQDEQDARLRETRRQLRARIRGRINDPAKIGPGAYDPGYVLDKHIAAPSIGQPPTDDEQMADHVNDNHNERLPGYGASTTGGMGPGHHLVNESRTQPSIPGFKMVNPDATRGEESPQAQRRRYRDRIREILAPRRDADDPEPAHPRDALRPHVPAALLDGIAEYTPTDQQRLAEWRRNHQWNQLVRSVAADDDRRAERDEARAKEVADRRIAIQHRPRTRARSLSPLRKLLLRLRYPSPPLVGADIYDTNRPFDRKPVFGYYQPTEDYGKGGVTARRKIWAMERKARNAKLAAKLAAAAERYNKEQQAKEDAKIQPFAVGSERNTDVAHESEGKDRGLLDADRWRNYGRDVGTDFGKSRPRVEPRIALLDELERHDGDELVLDVQRGHTYMRGDRATNGGVAWDKQHGRPEMTLSDTEVDYNRHNGRDMPSIFDIRRSNAHGGHKFEHDLGRPPQVLEDDRELYLSPRYTITEPSVPTINFGARTSAQRPPPWSPNSRDLGGFVAIDDDILHRRTRQADFSRTTGRNDNDAPATGLLASLPNDGDVLALSPRVIRGHQPGVDMARTHGRDNENASPRNDPSRFLHLTSPKRANHATDFTKASQRFATSLPSLDNHDGDELLLDPKPMGDDTRIRGHVSMASRTGRTDDTAAVRNSKDQRLVLSPHRADSKSMMNGPTFAQQIGRPTPYSIDGHPEEGDHLVLDPSRQDHIPGFVFGTSERFADIPADWIGRPSLMDLKSIEQLANERRARETKSPREDNHDILTRVTHTDYHRFPLDPTRADSITQSRTDIGSSFAPRQYHTSPRATDIPPRHGGLHVTEPPPSNPLRGASMKGPLRFGAKNAGDDDNDEHSNSNDGILNRDTTSSSAHRINGGRWDPEHKRVVRAGRGLPDDTRIEDHQPSPKSIVDPPQPSAAFARVIKPAVTPVDDRFALDPRYDAIEDRVPLTHLNSSTQRFKSSQPAYNDSYLYPSDDITRRDARSANFAMSMTNHDAPIVPPVSWTQRAAPLPPLLQPPAHHMQMIADRYYAPLTQHPTHAAATATVPSAALSDGNHRYANYDDIDDHDHDGGDVVVNSATHQSTRYQPLSMSSVPVAAAATGMARSGSSSSSITSPHARSAAAPSATTSATPAAATSSSDDPSPRMVAHVTSLLKAKMRRQRADAQRTTTNASSTPRNTR